MPGYRHTQVGWKVYGVLIPLSLIAVYVFLARDVGVLGLLVALLLATLAAFGSLTVDIGRRRMLIQFGIGLVRRTIALDSIRGFAPVTNRWYYGWGIRITPHGMLYNVSGLQAVEILLDDGRRLRVGTDEPEALVRALQSATSVSPSKTTDEFPKDVAWPRRFRLITATVFTLLVAFILGQMYLHSQPPSVQLANGMFSAGAGFYGVEIPMHEIDGVELVDGLPRIQRRTNGYAAGGVLRGNFRLEQWGSGKLFINRNTPPYLVVRSDDTFVVVNFENPARTYELYERLSMQAQGPKPGVQRP